jgi:hypothetical protein
MDSQPLQVWPSTENLPKESRSGTHFGVIGARFGFISVRRAAERSGTPQRMRA